MFRILRLLQVLELTQDLCVKRPGLNTWCARDSPLRYQVRFLVFRAPKSIFLRTKVQRRGLLVASRQRTRLLDIETSELQAGQSKAYAFQVGPYATGSDTNSVGSSTAKSHDKLDARSKPLDSENDSAGPPTEAAKVREKIEGFKHETAFVFTCSENFELSPVEASPNAQEAFFCGTHGFSPKMCQRPTIVGNRFGEGVGSASAYATVGFVNQCLRMPSFFPRAGYGSLQVPQPLHSAYTTCNFPLSFSLSLTLSLPISISLPLCWGLLLTARNISSKRCRIQHYRKKIF